MNIPTLNTFTALMLSTAILGGCVSKPINDCDLPQTAKISLEEGLKSVNLTNPQNSESLNLTQQWIANNIRLDFFDITTGDPMISNPGEVHLIIYAQDKNGSESECVQIMEAYEPLEVAVEKLKEFGINIDFTKLINEERFGELGEGIRTYYNIYLDPILLADKLGLERPRNLESTVIGQIVIEEINGFKYVRDLYPDNLVFFGAISRPNTQAYELEN